MVYYELKKVLGKIGSKISIILLTALLVSVCYSQTHEKSSNICWVNEQEQFEIGHSSFIKLREAQKEWTGVLDEDMLHRALTFLKQHPNFHERQGASQIRNLLNCSYQKNFKYTGDDYYNAEKINPSQLEEFYRNREKLMYRWLYDDSDPNNNGFYLYSDREKKFLIDRISDLEVPFQIESVVGWTQASEAIVAISTIGSIILGYLLTVIFTDEYRWKTDTVLFSTPNGRKQVVKAKIKAGFLMTTVLYWCMVFLSGIYLLSYFGFDGANCCVQVFSEYWFSIYHLSFLQRYLLLISSNYLGWLFMAAIVMMLSAACKFSAFPVIVPALLNIVPMWLLGDFGFSSKVYTLLPSSLFTLFLNIDDLTVYTIGQFVITPGYIVIPLYASLTMLFIRMAHCLFYHKK